MAMPMCFNYYEAVDMDIHYPGLDNSIEYVKKKGLGVVIPERDIQGDMLDPYLGMNGLLRPMSKEERARAVFDGINCFVRRPLNWASIERALKKLSRRLRFRRDSSGMDDSDDSDATPSTTELMYEHTHVLETRNGPRWEIDHTFEEIAADPPSSEEEQSKVGQDTPGPSPGTPQASLDRGRDSAGKNTSVHVFVRRRRTRRSRLIRRRRLQSHLLPLTQKCDNLTSA